MILALAMVLLLTACGGNGGNAGTGGGSGGVQDGGAGNAGNTGNAGNAGSAGDAGEAAPEGLALGETAATDIVELTLDRADLTIAVENTWGGQLLPAQGVRRGGGCPEPLCGGRGPHPGGHDLYGHQPGPGQRGV